MTDSAAQQRIRASGCDVRFDNLTRQLYATDASIYQIEPLGVAFPTTADEASGVIKAAAEENVSITPMERNCFGSRSTDCEIAASTDG